MAGQPILTIIFLVICSLNDIKSRRIPVYVYLIFLVFSIIANVCADVPALIFALGMLPGAIMAVVSFISNEKVGYGDAAALAVLGSIYGIGTTVRICIFSMGAVFTVSVILLAAGNIRKNDEIPFIPFLLLGSIIEVAVNLV